MAKVKAIPRNNSCFYGNDASLADLVNLDSSEELSPKNDFDIARLLSDNTISLEKRHFNDKDNEEKKSGTLHPLSEGLGVPSRSTMTAVDSNVMSLGALAKNHLENDRTLSDWCIDTDFNLTDLLCYDNSVTCAKATKSEDNLNIFGICLSTQDQSVNIKPINDVYVDDLSELVVDSCHVLSFHPCGSSDSNGSKVFDEQFSDLFISNLKNDDSDRCQSFGSPGDILSKGKQENINLCTEIDLSSVLNELSPNNTSETIEKKKEFSDETPDDELVPDIDLSFCIKKQFKDKFPVDTSSPESVDSGFDETDFTSMKVISGSPEKSLSFSVTYPPFGKEKLKCSKQSLLSRAISARPKISDERCAKLKKIQTELLKKQKFPSSLIGCNEQKCSQISDRIVDHSNECIIQSNFLTISKYFVK